MQNITLYVDIILLRQSGITVTYLELQRSTTSDETDTVSRDSTKKISKRSILTGIQVFNSQVLISITKQLLN